MIIEKSSIADLVARYGSSSATAWLEFNWYKLWHPTQPVFQSSFNPVQGYMEKGAYTFAWGNPLVSDPTTLPEVARQFINFCESQGNAQSGAALTATWRKSWVERSLAGAPSRCIYEDVIDPAHVLELTLPEAKGQESQKIVKDLKKNLYRADKYDVKVAVVKGEEVTEDDRIAIEQGIRDWKAKKGSVQIASTTVQPWPWLDSEHRRYWVARKDGKVVGILIVTPFKRRRGR